MYTARNSRVGKTRRHKKPSSWRAKRGHPSPAYLPQKLTENKDAYPHIWDGRRVFHLDQDDTFEKTVARLRRIFAAQTTLMPIFEALLHRMFTADTTLSRLAAHHARGLGEG